MSRKVAFDYNTQIKNMATLRSALGRLKIGYREDGNGESVSLTSESGAKFEKNSEGNFALRIAGYEESVKEGLMPNSKLSVTDFTNNVTAVYKVIELERSSLSLGFTISTPMQIVDGYAETVMTRYNG